MTVRGGATPRLIAVSILLAALPEFAASAPPTRDAAARAAVHPVTTARAMGAWLRHVPITRAFPPDMAETLRIQADGMVVEMSTASDCLPCADMWNRLIRLRTAYGLRIQTISPREALLRSGRLGLPWVGHPVLWVRPLKSEGQTIPVAVGTDHDPNVVRNIYLAVKMLGGVRPDVGLRAMAKFTGIVSPGHRSANK